MARLLNQAAIRGSDSIVCAAGDVNGTTAIAGGMWVPVTLPSGDVSLAYNPALHEFAVGEQVECRRMSDGPGPTALKVVRRHRRPPFARPYGVYVNDNYDPVTGTRSASRIVCVPPSGEATSLGDPGFAPEWIEAFNPPLHDESRVPQSIPPASPVVCATAGTGANFKAAVWGAVYPAGAAWTTLEVPPDGRNIEVGASAPVIGFWNRAAYLITERNTGDIWDVQRVMPGQKNTEAGSIVPVPFGQWRIRRAITITPWWPYLYLLVEVLGTGTYTLLRFDGRRVMPLSLGDPARDGVILSDGVLYQTDTLGNFLSSIDGRNWKNAAVDMTVSKPNLPLVPGQADVVLRRYWPGLIDGDAVPPLLPVLWDIYNVAPAKGVLSPVTVGDALHYDRPSFYTGGGGYDGNRSASLVRWQQNPADPYPDVRPTNYTEREFSTAAPEEITGLAIVEGDYYLALNDIPVPANKPIGVEKGYEVPKGVTRIPADYTIYNWTPEPEWKLYDACFGPTKLWKTEPVTGVVVPSCPLSCDIRWQVEAPYTYTPPACGVLLNPGGTISGGYYYFSVDGGSFSVSAAGSSGWPGAITFASAAPSHPDIYAVNTRVTYYSSNRIGGSWDWGVSMHQGRFSFLFNAGVGIADAGGFAGRTSGYPIPSMATVNFTVFFQHHGNMNVTFEVTWAARTLLPAEACP